MRRISLALVWLAALAPARPLAADDPLPAGAVARFGAPQFQDQSIGRAVAFSPDGTKLATAGTNGPVSVWDAATGKLLRTHKPVGYVMDLCWKPDGKLAAIAYVESGVFMHEWADGPDDGPTAERVREWRAAIANQATKHRYFTQAMLSPDGRRVVIVWYQIGVDKRKVEVFAFTPNTMSALAEPERSISLGQGYGVGLSRDGKFLIAHVMGTKEEGRLAAFDLTAGKESDTPAWEFTFKAEGERKVSQWLGADGRRVVVVFWDGDVEVWDGPGGKRLRELPKAPVAFLTGGGELPALALSNDGKRLALVTRGANGEVGGRVVDPETGNELVALAAGPLPRLGWGAAFSPDGKRLAVAGHGVLRVWDARTGADAWPLAGHRGRVTSVVAAPDGKTVVTAGDDLTVRAWDPATGKEKWKASFPRGARVAFALADAVVVEGPGVAEPLLDLATGKARALPGKMGEGRKTPPGFGGGEVVYDPLVAVAPNGKSAVTLRNTGAVLAGLPHAELLLWSWPGGELKATTPLDVPNDLYAVRADGRFTPDGKEFRTVTWCALRQPPISGPGTRPVLLDRWDAATGKRLERKETRDVSPVWAADGSRLLVVRDRGEVVDAFTEKAVARLPHHNTDPFTVWTLGGMALSPDGKTLAVGGDFFHPGTVRLYEMKSGRLLATLPAGGRGRLEVAFLPDGRLVSAGETALVWAADAKDRAKPEKP